MTERKDAQVSTGSLITTSFSTLGALALLWMVAIKVAPGVAPELIPASPSKGVLVMDSARYLTSKSDPSEEQMQGLVTGARQLAGYLASEGYTVVRAANVIQAPADALVPQTLLDDWAEKALTERGLTMPDDRAEGDN
ncbi:hypothetical protein [Halomonas sp. I5-271120]|uniref:hypothetical protein n=1 Tax=Halomonas sp. I5-271120 TaxID=3061632 RepID=UPI0027147435|nr:hypothetical protein [Halomonas sp. I5-271120]